jgi:hypothetical protein
MESGGLNLYGFVGNGPINRTDAFGLIRYDEDGFPIGGTVGGSVIYDDETKALMDAINEAGREKLKDAGKEVAKAGVIYCLSDGLGNLFGKIGGVAGKALGKAAKCFKGAGKAAKGGVLQNANYAQRTFNSAFSSGGTFAGQTVEDVAAGLRSGTLSPADVPVQYIVQDGNTLMLNTRSAQALEQAGIPRAQWNAVDMTGDAAAQARLAAQLQRNGLPMQGIPTVTPGP